MDARRRRVEEDQQQLEAQRVQDAEDFNILKIKARATPRRPRATPRRPRGTPRRPRGTPRRPRATPRVIHVAPLVVHVSPLVSSTCHPSCHPHGSSTCRPSQLETEIQTLEQQLEEMQATYQLNQEKLDYNFRVLVERDSENTHTCAEMAISAGEIPISAGRWRSRAGRSRGAGAPCRPRRRTSDSTYLNLLQLTLVTRSSSHRGHWPLHN